MRRSRYIHPYPHLIFNRNFANAWNDDCYHTWLIMDEGQERPDPQRLTNFLCKYCKKNKITGRSISSYIPKDYFELITKWVRMTKAERKKIREVDSEISNKINSWLTHAQSLYFYDLAEKL